MRAIALGALALLAARESDAQPAQSPAPSSTIEHVVAGHRLRLEVEGDRCLIEYRPDGKAPGKLVLDLRPPCYLPIWRQPPPARAADKASDGVPIGGAGAPMAWRYPGAQNVVAVAVIGDPLPEALRVSSLYRLREQQGMHCGASVQAVLLHAAEIRLSRKREHVGVLCAEIGLDEKDFWLLVHP